MPSHPKLPSRRLTAIFTSAVALAIPASAMAQATRTWVSGVGDDANPCSRTAPCKTWAGAISKTAAGGEIDALDPAGYGALTITKSITIDGGGGQVASTLVSGTNGFVVAAGATDRVIIRNTRINGLGPTALSLNGVKYISGASVSLENDAIFGFGANNGTDGNGVLLSTNGQADPRLSIVNSTLDENTGAGVSATDAASTRPARVTMVNDQVYDNGCGLSAGGGCTPRTASGSLLLISAYNSAIYDNTGAGVLAQGGVGNVALGNDDITGNGYGLQEAGPGGNIFSYGNNLVVSNDIDGTPNQHLSPRVTRHTSVAQHSTSTKKKVTKKKSRKRHGGKSRQR